MPVQSSRVLGGFLVLVLGLPPMAVLMARLGGDMASWADWTLLLAVELVIALGLVLASYLRRWLPRPAEPGLVPVRVNQPDRPNIY